MAKITVDVIHANVITQDVFRRNFPFQLGKPSECYYSTESPYWILGIVYSRKYVKSQVKSPFGDIIWSICILEIFKIRLPQRKKDIVLIKIRNKKLSIHGQNPGSRLKHSTGNLISRISYGKANQFASVIISSAWTVWSRSTLL